MKQGTNKKRRFAVRVAAMLFALLIFCGTLPVFAEQSTPPDISSSYGALYNLKYEKFLYEKGKDTSIYPASFAKVMTAFLCFEYRADVGAPADVTVAPEDDLSAGGIRLSVGETIPFDDLLYALVVSSANDAAMVLARVVGGSVESFVANMNLRAEQLGAKNTHFCNPTGLHNGASYTTLSDMALICAEAYQLNDYMQMASLIRYTLPATNVSKERNLTNANYLINPRQDLGYYVKGAMGINFGYTPETGYCLCSVNETKDGAINLILLSGGTKNEQGQNSTFLDGKLLFTYANDGYSIQSILSRDSVVREVSVNLSSGQDHVLLVAGQEITALLPSTLNLETDLTTRIFLNSEAIDAPVVEGTSYGSVEIYYGEEFLGSSELVAQQSIARSPSLYLMSGVENFFSLPLVRLILVLLLIAIVVLLLACLLILFVQKRRREGMTAAQRRALRAKQKELLRNEKERQRRYRQNWRSLQKKRLDALRAMRAEERARQMRLAHLAEERTRRAQNASSGQNRRPAPPTQRQGQPMQRQGQPMQRPVPPPRSTGASPSPRGRVAENPKPAVGAEPRRPQR